MRILYTHNIYIYKKIKKKKKYIYIYIYIYIYTYIFICQYWGISDCFGLRLTCLKIIKTFAIFFLPLILFVLFKRSIIIFTFLFFLITRAFKIVLCSYCYSLFREGLNSTSVWLNVHDCTSLLVQRQHTVLGKFHLAISRELVSPSSKRMDTSPKNCPQNIIIATLYRTVVVCRISLQMFSKHCRFRHNTVSVK